MRNILRLAAAAVIGAWMLTAMPNVATAQDAAVLTPAQEEAIQQVIRDYLLANPEIVYQSLQELQRRQKVAEQEKQRLAVTERLDELRNSTDDASIGDPDAAITVVEFFDYRCTYCKSVVDNMARLITDNSDVRIVFKEFPILGPESVYASRASLAARSHESHFDFHLALMRTRGNLTEEVVGRIAESVGIDFEKLKEVMASPEVDGIIKRNLALAQALGITGTPTFIIGDKVYAGALNYETMQTIIRTARAG
jgi:protein-disulfide isomerase